MTDFEYEEAYREALLCIPGANIANCRISEGVVRLCEIDGVALTDHQVFELAWGSRIADQIRRERKLTTQIH